MAFRPLIENSDPPPADSVDESDQEEIGKINTYSEKQKLTKYHVFAFFLTFFSYASFHATRKTFSNVKVTISATWTPENTSFPDIFDDNWNSHQLFKRSADTSVFLGFLDTIFMTSYAIGLFISGAVGDRLNLKYVLAFGMCSSSFTVFMFGVVSEWIHLYSKVYYTAFWFLTGLLQSTGWPTVIAVIENWFGRSNRGLVMGVWGACPCVGNILGTCLVNAVLHYGYEYSFLVTSCATFGFGIVILFSLIQAPRDVGLPDPNASTPDSEPLLSPKTSLDTDAGYREHREISESAISERPRAVGLCDACCLPGVLGYSLAYACLKFVNYSFFFWLPYYLQMNYKWNEAKADLLSIWYDVGGIVGGVLLGYISDKLSARSPIVGLMLFLSPFALFVYSNASADLYTNAGLMVILGIVIGGVASLISTAVSADLGRNPAIANSEEALSTVTGIIDGTGSFGAAIGQVLVPIIMAYFGWQAVFYVFIIMTFLSLLCIIQMVYRDTKELYRKLVRLWCRRVTRASIND